MSEKGDKRSKSAMPAKHDIKSAETAPQKNERSEDSMERMRRRLKRIHAGQERLERQFEKVQLHLAGISAAFDPTIDGRFFEAAAPLVNGRHTMLDYERLFVLWQAAENVAGLALPAVEIGTFRGGSAALIAQAFRTVGEDRELHVVDTFEGHLDSTFCDVDSERQRGKFQETTLDAVRTLFSSYPLVQIHKGDATKLLTTWPERQYALAHIDVDLYEPTLACLEYLAPRLATGGVLVMDDYESPTCPGVALAIDHYLSRFGGFQRWRFRHEQLVLIKQPRA